ncbi:hypothetical protein RRG08_002951 [Elysia crispata]|uniref:Uncharacterized protein n=1 Tax=Elysia crispata TaxID=231223 RepID=A0AAE1E284_9GAST|nr:hypothetical protein RRG08_002951 [Elysia crispata]
MCGDLQSLQSASISLTRSTWTPSIETTSRDSLDHRADNWATGASGKSGFSQSDVFTFNIRVNKFLGYSTPCQPKECRPEGEKKMNTQKNCSIMMTFILRCFQENSDTGKLQS